MLLQGGVGLLELCPQAVHFGLTRPQLGLDVLARLAAAGEEQQWT
jgi:hypothetical protein